MTWEPEQVERVVSLWNGGSSAREISNAIGESRNAILGVIYRQRKRTLRRESKIAAVPVARKPSKPTPAKTATNSRKWKALPRAKPVPLLEIEDCQCRWPIGEPFEGYCGLVCGETPYCPIHTEMATHRVSKTEPEDT